MIMMKEGLKICTLVCAALPVQHQFNSFHIWIDKYTYQMTITGGQQTLAVSRFESINRVSNMPLLNRKIHAKSSQMLAISFGPKKHFLLPFRWMCVCISSVNNIHSMGRRKVDKFVTFTLTLFICIEILCIFASSIFLAFFGLCLSTYICNSYSFARCRRLQLFCCCFLFANVHSISRQLHEYYYFQITTFKRLWKLAQMAPFSCAVQMCAMYLPLFFLHI